jgi:hypothetical protein
VEQIVVPSSCNVARDAPNNGDREDGGTIPSFLVTSNEGERGSETNNPTQSDSTIDSRHGHRED